MTSDRLIYVFPDRPPVRMASVVCPACGHNLATIIAGFPDELPYLHYPDGRGSHSDSGPIGDRCPVDSDTLATLIARAQLAHLAARIILEAVR